MLIYYLSGQVFEKDRVMIFILFSIVLGVTVNAIGFFYGTLLDLNVRIKIIYLTTDFGTQNHVNIKFIQVYIYKQT